MRYIYLLTVIGVFALANCNNPKLSVYQPQDASGNQVARIAVLPGSGILGDAIAEELLSQGVKIVDANHTDAIVKGIRINEYGITAREYYAALFANGIDAVLTAKEQKGYDGNPDNAEAQITDTKNGEVLIGISWQNGWGGYRNSDADQIMRKNTSEAAREMAEVLIKRLELK